MAKPNSVIISFSSVAARSFSFAISSFIVSLASLAPSLRVVVSCFTEINVFLIVAKSFEVLFFIVKSLSC